MSVEKLAIDENQTDPFEIIFNNIVDINDRAKILEIFDTIVANCRAELEAAVSDKLGVSDPKLVWGVYPLKYFADTCYFKAFKKSEESWDGEDQTSDPVFLFRNVIRYGWVHVDPGTHFMTTQS